MYSKERYYLHPVKSEQKLATKHFQIQEKGVSGNGTRIRRIESQHPAVHPNYRHAIMVEPKKGPAMMVYGSLKNIQEVSGDIKNNPDKVMRKIRPMGASPGGSFYLGEPAPKNMQNELTPSEMENASKAQKMFPDQGAENRPLDRKQEETQAAKQHLRDIATQKFGGSHPSSADGKAAVNAAMDRATKPATNSTLVTAPVTEPAGGNN